MNRKIIVELCLLLMVFVWALNFSIVKKSLADIDPLSFNAVRFLLAIVFIWLIVWKKKIPIKILPGDWPHLIILGFLGNLLYQLLFIYGIDLTYSANAAVMLGTIPIWVALISHFFFEEKLTKWKTIGVFFAFLGVTLILIGGDQGFSLTASNLLGDIIILLAAFVFSIYTLLSRSLLDRYTPLELSTIILTIGGSSLILIAVPALLNLDYRHVSLVSWGGVIYSGLLAIGLAYLVWNYAIKQVGAVRASTYQNLVPVAAIIFGYILLNEVFMIGQLIGTALVISGIVLARH